MALKLDNQEKEKVISFLCVLNKEAKMIVLLLGAPIQNPKNDSCPQNEKSGVFGLSSLLFSKLRIGQKYAMLTAQSKALA